MMSTDFQFHRPMDDTPVVAKAKAAEDQPAAALRKAILVVAANVAGAAALIWLTF